jgi:hypothetical protein
MHALVIADLPVKTFAHYEGIELLDELAVPLAALVLFSPVTGHDDVGDVQDVQQN